MARNELMAKYMMQNSNFDATIKDYNVTIEFMTENLQRGTHEEQNTHTVVTSDFQKLEFQYTMDMRNVKHSDEDGISDGVELGNEKWINITEFVRRTYEDAVRKGDPHKATFEAQVEDIIEKNGAYTDFNGNKVYGSVKWDDKKFKVLYRVYDYKSNPKLNDTDFDGLWDNADTKPIDNKFIGTSTEIGKVEYNQDFRWFYTNNEKYNDEVAVMSLIMSNLADGNSVSTDQASGDITTYLKSIDFTNPQNIGEGTDNIYVAKKSIQYYDNKKDVIGVFLGKCDRWYSDVIKYKEDQKAQVVNTAYRESIERYINRMINRITLLDTSNCYYWVSGYDVGGSIASEVASKLIENGKDVYAYTFGAFNTRDSLDTKNEIKNLRNEDDFFIKYITGTKPGQNYGASIFEDLMWEYRDLTGSSGYEGNYLFTNFLLYVYDEIEFLKINNESDADRILTNYFRTFNQITNQNDISNYADLTMLLNEWKKGNEQAHSIKSYYVLAKSLNGFDILDGDGEKQKHYGTIPVDMVLAFNGTEEIKNDSSITQALKDMAKWYVDNVFTYQGSKSYEDFVVADKVNGVSSHNMYMLGTGADNRIELLKNSSGNTPIFGGNYSLIGQKAGSDTEIKKKEGNTTNTYYFKRMTDSLLDFNYDWLCYIKASKEACENNHEYIKRGGSKLNYYTDCDKVSGFEYNDVGDDCARFAFAVLELGTGEEARNLGNLGKDAAQFLNDDDTKTKMLTYFDIYTGDSFIEEYNKGLKDGDMLVSKLNDGESATKKNSRNHCEFIYNNTLNPIGVFGWGNVKKTTNSRARFSIKKNNTTNVEYVYNSEDGTYYSALYRRKTQ